MSILRHVARTYGEIVKEIKQLEDEKEKIKKQIIEITENKNFKNEFITVSIIPESDVESIDKEAMKKDGIYDKYKVFSRRKGSEKITVKLEKINSENESPKDSGFIPTKFGQEKPDINGIEDTDDLPY